MKANLKLSGEMAEPAPAEGVVVEVVFWWDPHTRSWVTQARDANKNQVGEADYDGCKPSRDASVTAKLHNYGLPKTAARKLKRGMQ